jgi:hypothetical protein
MADKILPITTPHARQYPLTMVVPIDYRNLENGVTIDLGSLEGGAIVNALEVIVTAGFDTGTTLDVKLDGVSISSGAVNVETLRGNVGLIPLDSRVTNSKSPLTVDVVAPATPTQGQAYITLEYVVVGRMNEVNE